MALPSQSSIVCLNTPNKLGKFYPNDGYIDQFLRKLIFQPMEKSSTEFEFAQADPIQTTSFFSRNGTLPNKATDVSCLSNTFTRLGEHLQMDQFDQIGSNETDQIEQQIRGIKLGMLRQLSAQLITGSAAPTILGLNWQVSNSHGILLTSSGSASSSLRLQEIYQAIFACQATDNFIGSGGGYIVGNESALRQVLLFMDKTKRSLEWRFDPELGVRLPIIAGLPWLISNIIGISHDLTDIYVVKLRGDTAIRMLYVKSNKALSDRFGIQLYGLPLEANKNNQSVAVVGFYALHVPEDSIIVRLTSFLLSGIV